MSGPRLDLLAVVLGTREVASSRVRIHEPLDCLRIQGFRARAVLSGGRPFWPLQTLVLVAGTRPRTIILQKVTPPVWFVRVLRAMCRDVVFELDDAIYLSADERSQRPFRRARVLRIAKAAHRVTTSSPKIGDDLREAGVSRVSIFPGPAPARRASRGRLRRDVLWLGSPSTYSHVEALAPALEAMLGEPRHGQRRLRLVGVPPEVASAGGDRLVWSPATELTGLNASSIGIMPLTQSPWNDRKAAYKVLVYLANGLLPVVSDLPSVHATLGSSAPKLCVLVEGSSVREWQESIKNAMGFEPTGEWNSLRRELLAARSTCAYAHRLLRG